MKSMMRGVLLFGAVLISAAVFYGYELEAPGSLDRTLLSRALSGIQQVIQLPTPF